MRGKAVAVQQRHVPPPAPAAATEAPAAEIPPPATPCLPHPTQHRMVHNQQAQEHAPRVPGSSSSMAEASTRTAARGLRDGAMLRRVF